MTGSRPGILGFIDLWLLRIAKRRRQKFQDDEAFYEGLSSEKDIDHYREGLRNAWWFGQLPHYFGQFCPDRSVNIIEAIKS